jgi:hypothetical protein
MFPGFPVFPGVPSCPCEHKNKSKKSFVWKKICKPQNMGKNVLPFHLVGLRCLLVQNYPRRQNILMLDYYISIIIYLSVACKG